MKAGTQRDRAFSGPDGSALRSLKRETTPYRFVRSLLDGLVRM